MEDSARARDQAPLDRSGLARRKLSDGREFEIVKLFHEPEALAHRLHQRGWDGWVGSSGRFFLFGSMTIPFDFEGGHR
jgi:hypothetical protein